MTTPFRIAIRSEGNWINAYLAPMDSMEGADLIASIHRSLAEIDSRVFDSWRHALEQGVGAHCAQIVGEPVEWLAPIQAPEHERSGRS